jgi:uncharacterized Zn-binding protein involved in type VI secretion
MGQLVTHGDTTTRGVVIAVASRMFEKGRRLALHGEEATCGNCKGSFKIVGTATRTRDNGRALVQHGDWVMCPCGKNRVLADSKMHYHNEGSVARAPSAAMAGAAPMGSARVVNDVAKHVYDRTFVITNNQTGKPLPTIGYRLTLDNGQVVEGTTDERGVTQRVSANERQNVKIEVFV